MTHFTPMAAPAPPAYFTGRGDELAALAEALTTGDAPQAITALLGMGGIGKTALAAQLAVQLEDDFPGGVFWADLPADNGDPLPVLAAWARLCGHDVSKLPDPQARAQAVRDALTGCVAERGRLLVVLDDVRQEWLDGARVLESARPPGVPLLLTTRQARVAQALGVRITRIDTLSPNEARKLLGELTDDALTGDDADRVAELCSCLPLALEIAAAAAVQEGVACLLARLNDAATRLDALELDDSRRKEESVRLAFDVSYQALVERYPQTARAFRYLGVFAPAPLSPTRLAGVLAEVEQHDGQRGFRQMTGKLLSWLPGRAKAGSTQVEAADGDLRRLIRWGLARREGGRYTLHHLLCNYAAARLEEAGEDTTVRAAHAAHYLALAEAHEQSTAVDCDALEAERPNVLAAMDHAYREEQWVQVRRFMWALDSSQTAYLRTRGYWGELRTRLEQAIRAAEAEGNRRDAAAFAANLAELMRRTGDLDAASQEYQRVLAIFEELGEQKSVAVIYYQLGMVAQAKGDYSEARRLYWQSLYIFEELQASQVIVAVYHQLGRLAQDTGDYPEARCLYRQSMEVKEQLGDRAGVARSLEELADLAKAEGDQAEAERLYRRSWAIAKEIGDVVWVGVQMFNLALLCEDQGRLDEALSLLEQAVEIDERVGTPRLEKHRRALERVRGKVGE